MNSILILVWHFYNFINEIFQVDSQMISAQWSNKCGHVTLPVQSPIFFVK